MEDWQSGLMRWFAKSFIGNGTKVRILNLPQRPKGNSAYRQFSSLSIIEVDNLFVWN